MVQKTLQFSRIYLTLAVGVLVMRARGARLRYKCGAWCGASQSQARQ